MNAKITRAKTQTACANCSAILSASDFVADTLCLACFMASAKISPKDFSPIFKISVGCEDLECAGYPRHAFALQYDHTSHATKYRTKSGKIVEPSDLFRTCSVAVFVAEVAKCVVRCANCHAIKTARERGL